MAEKTSIQWCDSTCTECGVGLTPDNRAEPRRLRCKSCRNRYQRTRYQKKGPPLHSGPRPNPPRSGDKQQARQRINVEVRTGRRPRANALPCVDCGHIWSPGERRHEYDHYLGYDAEHHYHVQAVCTVCHSKRDNKKTMQTSCVNGHAFTPDNTGFKPNGTRFCRECRRDFDRNRRGRDAQYWRDYRANRKARSAAGRTLDGRTWDKFPAGRAQ